MAPEVIGGSHFPTACDMWSIGVIAYLLLCGYPPFSGETRDKLKWQIRVSSKIEVLYSVDKLKWQLGMM